MSPFFCDSIVTVAEFRIEVRYTEIIEKRRKIMELLKLIIALSICGCPLLAYLYCRIICKKNRDPQTELRKTDREIDELILEICILCAFLFMMISMPSISVGVSILFFSFFYLDMLGFFLMQSPFPVFLLPTFLLSPYFFGSTELAQTIDSIISIGTLCSILAIIFVITIVLCSKLSDQYGRSFLSIKIDMPDTEQLISFCLFMILLGTVMTHSIETNAYKQITVTNSTTNETEVIYGKTLFGLRSFCLLYIDEDNQIQSINLKDSDVKISKPYDSITGGK